MSREQVYHGLFHDPHQRPHGEASASHVEQQIHDELARAVISDLSAAVGLDDRNAAVHSRQVLAAARDAQRVDRRMLGEPQLVGRVAQRAAR